MTPPQPWAYPPYLPKRPAVWQSGPAGRGQASAAGEQAGLAAAAAVGRHASSGPSSRRRRFMHACSHICRAPSRLEPLHLPHCCPASPRAPARPAGGHPIEHRAAPARLDHAPVESGRCSRGFSGAAVACTLICRAPRCCWVCLQGAARRELPVRCCEAALPATCARAAAAVHCILARSLNCRGQGQGGAGANTLWTAVLLGMLPPARRACRKPTRLGTHGGCVHPWHDQLGLTNHAARELNRVEQTSGSEPRQLTLAAAVTGARHRPCGWPPAAATCSRHHHLCFPMSVVKAYSIMQAAWAHP